MPAGDVSDLRDVVDAINRLCDTMKTSGYEETQYEDCVDAFVSERAAGESDEVTAEELVGSEAVAAQAVEAYTTERWSETAFNEKIQHVVQSEESETTVSDIESEIVACEATTEHDTVASETEQTAVSCEPISEMYYTASSEVSLLSDVELLDRGQDDESRVRDYRENVIAGHVAAMRERFESMTRANTPCPDLVRSLSPSLDVFRNITPSPDRLDE